MAIFRSAVRVSLGTEDYICVFHIQAATTTPAAINAAFAGTAGVSWIACLPNIATLEDITTTDLSNMTQDIRVIGTLGSIVGEVCPPQAAGLISWRTAQVGRKYRGRTYLPCVPEANQASGLLDNPLQSLYSTLATGLRSSWPSLVSGQLVVYHRIDGTYTPITSHLIRDYAYTQRRRTRGVGS